MSGTGDAAPVVSTHLHASRCKVTYDAVQKQRGGTGRTAVEHREPGGCAGCEAHLVIASQLAENDNIVAGGRARDNEADEPEGVGNLSWHVDARGEEARHGEAAEWHEHETC